MSTTDASAGTRRLLHLCAGYFASYVVTGVALKYFIDGREGFPNLGGITFLLNSTLASNGVVLIVIFAFGWIRLKSNRLVKVGPFRLPSELAYIIPSGICTGIIIPTTTLMYTLPISIMVAMVMMRGSVIVTGRVVDAILIHQGILKKKVYAEENVAVILAVAAVAVASNVFGSKGGFDFVRNTEAVTIFLFYIVAYAFRIYIMNYYKNTRAEGVPHDSRGFFALEQLAATATLIVMLVLALNATSWFSVYDARFDELRTAVTHLDPGAMLAGVPYGILAFFSVFIFLYKGRTATFAGLVNRLTSLVAGIVATVVFAGCFGGRWPTQWQWFSVALIVAAVFFLTRAEKRRTAELAAEA